jgi:hypothetical protein
MVYTGSNTAVLNGLPSIASPMQIPVNFLLYPAIEIKKGHTELVPFKISSTNEVPLILSAFRTQRPDMQFRQIPYIYLDITRPFGGNAALNYDVVPTEG